VVRNSVISKKTHFFILRGGNGSTEKIIRFDHPTSGLDKQIDPLPRQFLASKHSLSLRIIFAALTLLFSSSFGMAGEPFIYTGSKSALVNPPSGLNGVFSGEKNTLLPANSADPTSGNDITIDYVTGTGMTDPVFAMGGYSDTGGLVENNRIGLKQGKVTERLFGGYSYTTSGDTDANYNTVTVSGDAKVSENVWGGRSNSSIPCAA
jgi:hypothetical protein